MIAEEIETNVFDSVKDWGILLISLKKNRGLYRVCFYKRYCVELIDVV